MLHQKKFLVNEAWIAFQLNETPIEAGDDGAFNCIALMDVASGFILTSELVPLGKSQPSQLSSRRALNQAASHKQELPTKLFIANEWPAKNLAKEAERLGIAVERVPEEYLLHFIGEAREGFKERFGGRSLQ